MNSVISALVEEGELDPNAEVWWLEFLFVYYYCSESTSGSDKPYISLAQSQGCGC